MARWSRSDVLAAALCVALVAPGCSGTSRDSARATGSAQVAVLGVTPEQIAKVTVTITGGMLTSPIVRDLSPTGAGWAGTVPLIPAGTDYTFTVEAFGAGSPGPLLYRGTQAGVTITAGETAAVAITLLPLEQPWGPSTKVPIVAGYAASSTSVLPGARVRVDVAAFSPEGHALAYLWQSACGTFADPTQAETDWTAGLSSGPCSLSVRVSDATNTTAVTVYLVIEIQGAGGAEVTASVNTYPSVVVTVEEHLVTSANDPSGWPIGITVDLVASGSDPDGDALSYAWNGTCFSSFEPSADVAAVRYHVDDPTAACELSVRVSDARGLGITAHVETSVLQQRIVKVAAGWSHVVAVQANGSLWAWGSNDHGELGDDTTAARLVPNYVGWGYASVAASYHDTLAVKGDGTLWGWGANGAGQLGDGTTTNRFVPTLIGSGYASVAAGYLHSVAIKTDGTLWTWGYNLHGALGDGTTISRTAPAQVGAGFASAAAGSYHTVAVKTDGTLWAWGSNSYGQLGDGTVTNRLEPVQIGAGFAFVAASGESSFGIKTDGTLWGWGYNDGQLGDGSTSARSLPVLIGSGFASVAAGTTHTVALKTDGTLWTWGYNESGQLGDGSTTHRFTPMQIGTGFASVAAGAQFTVAIKQDGTLWAWGDNDSGQLGDRTEIGHLTPELVIFLR